MAGRHGGNRPPGVLRIEQPLTPAQAAELSRRIEAWHVDVEMVGPPEPVAPARAAALVFVAGLAGCLAILLVPLALVLR